MGSVDDISTVLSGLGGAGRKKLEEVLYSSEVKAKPSEEPKSLADYVAYVGTASSSDLESALAGLSASTRKQLEEVLASTVDGNADQVGEAQQQEDSKSAEKPAETDTQQQQPPKDDIVLLENGPEAKSC